jgi:hypothetical protein
MNVQASYVIPMLPVLTTKVLLTVNAMLGIMELDLIVQVSKLHFSLVRLKYLINFFNPLLFVICIIVLDINECSSKPCHPNATCTDKEGSFDCECNVGYSGNGFNCSSK